MSQREPSRLIRIYCIVPANLGQQLIITYLGDSNPEHASHASCMPLRHALMDLSDCCLLYPAVWEITGHAHVWGKTIPMVERNRQNYRYQAVLSKINNILITEMSHFCCIIVQFSQAYFFCPIPGDWKFAEYMVFMFIFHSILKWSHYLHVCDWHSLSNDWLYISIFIPVL